MNPHAANAMAAARVLARHYASLQGVDGLLSSLLPTTDQERTRVARVQYELASVKSLLWDLHAEAAKACADAGEPITPLQSSPIAALVEEPPPSLPHLPPPTRFQKPNEWAIWDDERKAWREPTTEEKAAVQREMAAQAKARVFQNVYPLMGQMLVISMKDFADEDEESAAAGRAARIARKYTEAVLAEAKEMHALDAMNDGLKG